MPLGHQALRNYYVYEERRSARLKAAKEEEIQKVVREISDLRGNAKKKQSEVAKPRPTTLKKVSMG